MGMPNSVIWSNGLACSLIEPDSQCNPELPQVEILQALLSPVHHVRHT